MNISLPAALFLVALLAAGTSFAAKEDSKLVEDGAAYAGNATDVESGGNKTRPKEDTFADMIDRALEKEFTENEDQSEGFLGSQFFLLFLISLFLCLCRIC